MEKIKFIEIENEDGCIDKKCPDCNNVISLKLKHAYDNEWCPNCGLNLDIVKKEFEKQNK